MMGTAKGSTTNCGWADSAEREASLSRFLVAALSILLDGFLAETPVGATQISDMFSLEVSDV